MSWDLINHHLIHTSESVMKSICRHQIINGYPKHFPQKKTNHHAQYIIQKI